MSANVLRLRLFGIALMLITAGLVSGINYSSTVTRIIGVAVGICILVAITVVGLLAECWLEERESKVGRKS